jgi:PncC family amidohydrolase
MKFEENEEQLREAAGQLLQVLKNKNLKIAFAESMTGGLLSGSLTRIPGTSSVLTGAVVSYDIESKIRLLSVDKQLLCETGAESAEVAIAMAEGLPALFPHAGLLVAITGSASAPVNDYRISSPPGTVFLAYGRVGKGLISRKWNLTGNRDEVLRQAVWLSMNCIREFAGTL